MDKKWQIIFLLIASLSYGNAACGGKTVEKTHEERLNDCFETSRSTSKMLPGGPRPIEVTIAVPLLSLLDYNDLENTIEVQLSTRYKWQDPSYKWDPEQFGGKKYMLKPAYRIWKPVPSVLLNRNEERQHMETMKIRIWYNGTVEWFLFLHATTTCMTDFTDFPYDTQTCEFRIYHFPYPTSDLNITVEDFFELEVLTAQWKERDAYIMHETFLSTQPDGKVEEHVTYAFTFILDRKTIFFNYVIVCPSICILIFILFLFMIPIQSNQRFVMASFLFMSTISLYLSAQHMLPPGIGKVPFIVKYITLDFILLLLVFIISIVTYYIYHHDNRQPLPPILKQIFLNRYLKRLANVSFPFSMEQSSSDNSDRQGSATQASKVPSPGEQIDRTLDDLQRYLSALIVERDSQSEGSSFEMLVASEWKQMALVFERLCLIVFGFLSIIITIIMFSSKFNMPVEEERFL